MTQSLMPIIMLLVFNTLEGSINEYFQTFSCGKCLFMLAACLFKHVNMVPVHCQFLRAILVSDSRCLHNISFFHEVTLEDQTELRSWSMYT